jgi:NAD(P)-dependent dehydrogenase (short-subunit alcohol dehydrogenase family)
VLKDQIRRQVVTVPSLSLLDKVAVVTGARRGIGRAIALAFAEAGADVAILDKVVETGELDAVAQEIENLGRRSLAVKVDVTRKSEVDSFAKMVVDRFGRIDVLVNNAGIFHTGSLLEFREESWDEVVDTDLKGYFLCAHASCFSMIDQRSGNIINIASDDAFRASKVGSVSYGVAKAGVVMLTRILAKNLAAYNIRVNAIAPGTVKTDLSKHAWSDPEYLREMEADIAQGRIGEPSDLIGPALFLASEASDYITGQTIVVDGGRMA